MSRRDGVSIRVTSRLGRPSAPADIWHVGKGEPMCDCEVGGLLGSLAEADQNAVCASGQADHSAGGRQPGDRQAEGIASRHRVDVDQVVGLQGGQQTPSRGPV